MIPPIVTAKGMKKIKTWFFGIVISLVLIVVAAAWYEYHFSSLTGARNHGGTYTTAVPTGGEHISTAWKGDELWTETYFPADNKCVYQQITQYGLIQGSVVITPCNYRSGSK